MKKSAFFAPIIRGAIINELGCPWTIHYDSNNEYAHLETCPITFEKKVGTDTESEKYVADKISSVLKKSAATIPLAFTVNEENESYTYLSAPDFIALDNLKQKKQTTAWQKSAFKPYSSRADVVKNRIVMVTGGAQGFGEEIVRGLVQEGSIVFIADLNSEGAENLAQELNAYYKKQTAFPIVVNVADEDSVINMMDTIAEIAGGFDLCISNAGVLKAMSILDQDMKSFRFVTDINYTGFAMISKHSALLMKRQNIAAPAWQTDIVQINSKSGLEGSNKNGSYAGGKFGGIGLVQSFALELVAYGIKVNAICPGNFFDGPLWSDPEKGLFVQYLNTGKVKGAKTVADVKQFYEGKVPMNKGCTGIDVLRAVFYIVEQSYETGQAIPVTGGQVMLS